MNAHAEQPSECSIPTGEQLPGTAKPGGLTIAVENLGGWGHDILDGDALGPELSHQLKAHLKNHRAGLQFIRKPGREGQQRKNRSTRTCYLAWPAGVGERDGSTGDGPVLEILDIATETDLLSLDLSGPGRNADWGARVLDRQLLLVCTHGKRDRCCAVYGRPIAHGVAATVEQHNSLSADGPGSAADDAGSAGHSWGGGPINADVWESSHTKGHRLAPSMILLPSNYSFGRLGIDETCDMLREAADGRLPLVGNRGRGTLDAAGQVAELGVARYLAEEAAGNVAEKDAGKGTGENTGHTDPNLAEWASSRIDIITRQAAPAPASVVGLSELEVSGETLGKKVPATVRLVKDPACGRIFSVALAQRPGPAVRGSCGDAAKSSKTWVILDLQEIRG